MNKVSWYKQRLKALLFKARFADKVEEIKPVRNKLSLSVFRCLGLTNWKLSQLSVSRKRQASHLSNPCAWGCFLIGGERWKNNMIVKNDLRPRPLQVGQGNRMIIIRSSFLKSPVNKIFSVHTKTNAGWRNPLVWRDFRRAPFSWRIQVQTIGLTVERKLCFQLPLA